ncbi:MAG: DUF4352 domain-containing protein [Bacilli bacterium]|nr:DUF4352 domain-containing protein [Bacilli bacterium]
MVLKKPYAFLIKHFRLIHLLLIAPIIYLLIQSNKIVKFFNGFASSGTYDYANNIASQYINIWMYLAIILILLVVVIITYLFIIKKKSIRLYLGIIIYYLILFIGFTICYSALAGLEDEIMEITKVRIYRDVSLILYLPQFFFLVYCLIRGIGFDLKRFDFNKDLKELEIEEKDNEEVEITFEHDNYKLKRKIRRYLREFKYYYFENKFIISIIGAILIVISGAIIFYNIMIYHRTYKEMQVVNINGFSYTVNNSILTNMDYRGNLIENKYYLAISMDITNITTNSLKIAKKDLTLDVGGKYYYPIYDRGDYYNDLGIAYRGEKLKPHVLNTYVIVYEIPKKEINKKMSLVIFNEYNVHHNDLVATKKTIRIKPEYLLTSNKVNEVKINKKLEFTNSILDGVSLKVTEVNLTGYFEYNSQNGKTIVTPDYSNYGFGYAIIALKDELKTDKKSYYAKTITKKILYNNHGSLYFKYGDKYIMADVIDITPKDLKDTTILQVDKRFLNSSDIRLVISLRNKSYFIKLK